MITLTLIIPELRALERVIDNWVEQADSASEQITRMRWRERVLRGREL